MSNPCPTVFKTVVNSPQSTRTVDMDLLEFRLICNNGGIQEDPTRLDKECRDQLDVKWEVTRNGKPFHFVNAGHYARIRKPPRGAYRGKVTVKQPGNPVTFVAWRELVVPGKGPGTKGSEQY